MGWSHHMEGEVEYCVDCGAEIVPFTDVPKYGEYVVTLRLRVRSDGATPDAWDWAELLDLAPGEGAQVEVIGEKGLLSSQKITPETSED